MKAPWYIELERLSIVGEASLDGPERQLAKSVHGQRDVHAGPFVPLGQLASLEVAIPGEPRLREEHVPLIHRVPGKTGVQPSFRSLFHSIRFDRTNNESGRGDFDSNRVKISVIYMCVCVS